MGSITFILICAAEVTAVLLFVIFVLLFKIRKLKSVLQKLKARAEEMRTKLKEFASRPPVASEICPLPESYRDKLNQQLEITKSYHYDLGSRQDIALDLDPDAPAPRRAAALRNAFLIAEKEATSEVTDEINWDLLSARYQKLLDFNQDYAPDNDAEQQYQDELEQLKTELEQDRKRINNLNRFKSMYFELEERWNKCKSEADGHYIELKNIAAESNQRENFERALENYQASYQEVGRLMEKGDEIEEEDGHNPQRESAFKMDGQSQELSRLRTVAADQHRIINELQLQLSKATETEEQLQIMDTMQVELKKQARFLQESETCIQLMDNELTTAKRELEQLRMRVREIPQLKAALKDLIGTAGTQEQITDSLKHENRRLAKKLKLALESPAGDNNEAKQLRKELTSLQANYNDLEERFLDLKMQN